MVLSQNKVQTLVSKRRRQVTMAKKKGPICHVIGCFKMPSYGLERMKPTHCSPHGKQLGMKNVTYQQTMCELSFHQVSLFDLCRLYSLLIKRITPKAFPQTPELKGH